MVVEIDPQFYYRENEWIFQGLDLFLISTAFLFVKKGEPMMKKLRMKIARIEGAKEACVVLVNKNTYLALLEEKLPSCDSEYTGRRTGRDPRGSRFRRKTAVVTLLSILVSGEQTGAK